MTDVPVVPGQATLWPADDPRLHARTDDVDTSHDAAAAAAYQQRWKVLATYAAGVASDYTGATYYVAGPAQTDHAAYAAAGLDMVATAGRQRCSDLRHLGYIVRTGEKGTTPAGRSAHLCAITEAGLDALAALR